MKMSKRATKSTLSDINGILEISDSYQAPQRVMEILIDPEKSKKCFFEFMEYFDFDLSYDWFFEYFQEEHADRKNNKQDFTPLSVCKLLSKLIDSGEREDTDYTIIEEPAAGTGGNVIAHWYEKNRECRYIWNYSPDDYLYICTELSSKTVPFLIFNIMIRGINAIVIHGDSLTRKAKNIFWIYNESNNAMGFSELYAVPHTEKIAEMFGVIWENE